MSFVIVRSGLEAISRLQKLKIIATDISFFLDHSLLLLSFSYDSGSDASRYGHTTPVRAAAIKELASFAARLPLLSLSFVPMTFYLRRECRCADGADQNRCRGSSINNTVRSIDCRCICMNANLHFRYKSIQSLVDHNIQIVRDFSRISDRITSELWTILK